MPVLKATELNENIAEDFSKDKDIDLNFGLSIKPYDIISLVAPTGAGKTTFTCNLFEPLNKPILYFSLEESKETMACRIKECCGKEKLKNFMIIDQSDFISSKDDFLDILDTIKDTCENNEKYGYAAIVIDHLTCISSLKKHKNPINLLKQETVKHKIPLFIINQYQTVNGRSEGSMAGGREMLFYATLSLELLTSLGNKKNISEEEAILYDVDFDDLGTEDSIYTLDAKRNVKFKSDNLRLLKLGQKNRYANSFQGVLLDFDLKEKKYIVFDKDAKYSEEQKKIIIKWNEICASLQKENYYFDEENASCFKINKEIIGYINTFLLTYNSKSEIEILEFCNGIKKMCISYFNESGILEMKNIITRIKQMIIKQTSYCLNPQIIKLKEELKCL